MNAIALALIVRMILPFVSGDVEVHEWGVVTFSASGIVVEGVPLGEYGTFGPVRVDYGLISPLVDAPVIFFHGGEFTGDLTVSIPDGMVTEIYPQEGMRKEDGSITWCGIEVLSRGIVRDMEEGMPPEGFAWEADVLNWRSVRANTVRTSGGSEEGFLYYECAMYPLDCLDYPRLLAGGEGLPEGVDRVLVFLKSSPDRGEMYLMDPRMAFMPVQAGGIGVYRRETVMETLEEWAGARLNSDELEVMWDTWEDFVTGGEWDGDALVVFPLPEGTVERISTLSLKPDPDIRVSYGRFFIGMAPLIW